MEPTPSQLNQLKIGIIFKTKLFFEFNQEKVYFLASHIQQPAY